MPEETVQPLDPALVAGLFAPDLPEPAEWEARYPARELPPGAYVTRFGPSPTGFVHIGGLYAALLDQDLARSTGGVYFVRIEDTDQAREVEGAREQFDRAFAYFGLVSDEDDEHGVYGPYEQSRRSEIYQSFARELLLAGRAYPCFCTKGELAAAADAQRAAKVPTGYYGRWATCRNLTPDEVAERLARGLPYTIRFRSPGDVGARVAFEDVIRGTIEHEDNRNDVVILKSSDVEPRLPTYHFAHAVDDHLMRVTLVLRAEEWISSVPLHLQLFTALGFEPIPYAHIAPLMKMEGSSRRKLSKRKDPEANVDYYLGAGYPARAILHYLRGLANSKLADMPFDEAAATPIRLDEAGIAGPLVDLLKLDSIARDWIATLPAATVHEEVLVWARDHDPELAALLEAREETSLRALAVEREGAENPRKDLAKWSDFRPAYGFFFAELFEPVADPADERFAPLAPELVRTLARDFAAAYEHEVDGEAWFDQVRRLAAAHGFAPGVKQYRQEPDRYPGSIREVSTVIRVLLTGAARSPDLYEVSRVLGRDEVLRRVGALG